MNTETSQWILYAIAVTGAIVWMAGLQFLAGSAQARRRAAREAGEQFDTPQPGSENLIYGTAEVEGQRDALITQAAAVLATPGLSQLGLVKILDRSSDRLTFECAGQDLPGRSMRSLFERGQIRFTAVGPDRTRVDYAVQISAGRGLLLGGMIFQVLGLIALVIGFGIIHTYVVRHPNPAVRAQTFQMLQVIHFLWPPFLFGALYRARERWVRAGFDALVHNLPHLKA